MMALSGPVFRKMNTSARKIAIRAHVLSSSRITAAAQGTLKASPTPETRK
jgi:hypothetical protein